MLSASHLLDFSRLHRVSSSSLPYPGFSIIGRGEVKWPARELVRKGTASLTDDRRRFLV